VGWATTLPSDFVASVSGQQQTVGLLHAATSLGITRVWNPLPAGGGIDPEEPDHVRFMAPWAFRTQERAVTAPDYAVVAEQHHGVQKAAGRIRWTGSWYTAFVTVDRVGGAPVDRAFDSALTDYFDRYRMAGRDVEIDQAIQVPLDVALTVCVAPGHIATVVEQEVRDALGARTGFFHPDRFTFGDPVFLSRVYETVSAVPGVEWVEATRFQRWGEEPNDELDAGVLPPGRLEVVRLDNDPNFPENGLLEITTRGGV
jgi:predicted phage baseplate assembly protein